MKNKRKYKRFSFSITDGVYCIIARANSKSRNITLLAKDFSQSGFRFVIVASMKNDFLEGEKLFLKTIAGTRNLTFKEPIELRVRWQEHDHIANMLDIGCEIFNITIRDKINLSEFINAEVKFRGQCGQTLSQNLSKNNGSRQKSTRVMKHSKRRSFNIVSIFVGFRHEGSTEKIINWVEEELIAKGHQVERINLFSRKVNDRVASIQFKNDFNETEWFHDENVKFIIDKMVLSDVIIFTIPLHCLDISSQMKALIDQCRCLNKERRNTTAPLSFTESHRQAMLLTTTDTFENSAGKILTTFRMMHDNKTHCAGRLFVCSCGSPDDLGNDIREQAKIFAKQLVSA